MAVSRVQVQKKVMLKTKLPKYLWNNWQYNVCQISQMMFIIDLRNYYILVPWFLSFHNKYLFLINLEKLNKTD